MDWMEIGSRALMAGVAGALSVWLVRTPADPDQQRRTRLLRALVALVVFVGLNLAYTTYAKPRIDARRTRAAFAEVPAFAAIQAKEPALFDEMMTEVTSSGVMPDDPATVAMMTSKLSPLVPQYLRRAGDEALVEFTQATVATLKERRASSEHGCFFTLFPAAGTLDERNLALFVPLSAESQSRTMQALTGLFTSAADTDRPFDRTAAAARFQETVTPKLQTLHGDKLALMVTPAAAVGFERQSVCDITIDMFDTALALSPDRVLVLRHMYAQ